MIKTISYWSMKDGLSNKHPIDDALKTAKVEGFEAIELCIAPDGVLSTQSTQAECEKIRQQADKIGVKVETLAAGITWGMNPTSNDAATRKRSIELHSAALQRAAWL